MSEEKPYTSRGHVNHVEGSPDDHYQAEVTSLMDRLVGSSDGTVFSAERTHILNRLQDINRINLQRTAPELFEGRLPEYLESRLWTNLPSQFVDYALGSYGRDAMTVEEAVADVPKFKAPDSMPTYFKLFSPGRLPEGARMIDDFLTSGYYGPSVGRFIYAFPVTADELHAADGIADRAIAAPFYIGDPSRSPEDMSIELGENTIVNPKYFAGFIDVSGTFWANGDFMTGEQFTPVHSEEMIS